MFVCPITPCKYAHIKGQVTSAATASRSICDIYVLASVHVDCVHMYLCLFLYLSCMFLVETGISLVLSIAIQF